MKSIDALAPQTDGDTSPQINEANVDSSKMVEQLVAAVKEVSDVHAAATEKLVDKFTEVLEKGKVADRPADDEPDASTDGNGGDSNE